MKTNVIIFILLIIILLILGCIILEIENSVDEKYRYIKINKSQVLENTFKNGSFNTKFLICDQWSKNNYRNNSMNISYTINNNNKIVELEKSGKTERYLKDECPIILNQQMLNDLQKNILQPHECVLDYSNKNDIYVYDENDKKDYCYSGPFQSYSRQYFDHWINPVGDGCSVRDNILYTSADINVNDNKKVITYKENDCSPATGAWFVYQDMFKKEFNIPSEVEVDHTVPLKNAWNNGAYKWSPWQLRAYANDATPGHLELMEKSANSSKGDSSIDEWTPKKYYDKKKKIINKSVDCQYAADYAAVKHRWNLSLTPQEHDKLNTVLMNGQCKEIPKAEVFFNKSSNNNTGLGKSLADSYYEPDKIEIFGINTNLYNQFKQIKYDKNNYTYCKTKEENIILPTKDRKQILSNLKNQIENNPILFGIKNLDHFDTIKSDLGKDKTCKILYNKIDRI